MPTKAAAKIFGESYWTFGNDTSVGDQTRRALSAY
jgi:hypothetical protein